MRETQAVRYRCTTCGRTFRHYPEGVSHYRQSRRVMGLAVLLWTLGLSDWATSHVLYALDAGIHRSSVHRDRLRAGALLQQRGMAVGRVAQPQRSTHSGSVAYDHAMNPLQDFEQRAKTVPGGRGPGAAVRGTLAGGRLTSGRVFGVAPVNAE